MNIEEDIAKGWNLMAVEDGKVNALIRSCDSDENITKLLIE